MYIETNERMKTVSGSALPLVILAMVSLMLGGCGSLTGIPSHGGGKRFAVEQEMIAAATRATLKQLPLDELAGKRVNLFINTIGDKGAGNISGGRLNIVSQLRGDYIQSPKVVEKSHYPRYRTGTISTSSTRSKSDDIKTSSDTETKTLTSSTLGSPDEKITQKSGKGYELQVGAKYEGLGAFQNSKDIVADDLRYLTGLLETWLFLQGVIISAPSEAEVDVYVTVDVFGTVRTRVDWFIANNEILKAKTVIEMMAVDHQTGEIVMKPRSAGTEAEYNEQYLLWMGPISIKKFLHTTEPLLVDFSTFSREEEEWDINSVEQNGKIAYPFRHQIERWGKD